jgi:hypothetical protein
LIAQQRVVHRNTLDARSILEAISAVVDLAAHSHRETLRDPHGCL